MQLIKKFYKLSVIRPVKWGFKKGKKLGKAGIYFIIFRIELFITY